MNLTAHAFSWNSPQAEEAKRIRFTVFVDEQKVPPELELDEIDEVAFHVLVRSNTDAIGTGRLYEREDAAGVGRIGRVAVLKEWRHMGAGRAVMMALMSEGHARRYERLLLDSQVQAIPFYEGLGFSIVGELHDDAGIPHRYMEITAHQLARVVEST